MGTADPLEVGDGRSGWDDGVGIEESVAAPLEGLVRAPDVEEGDLAGARPGEEVAGRGEEGGGEALRVEAAGEADRGDFFEGGEGEGARGVVGEEGDEGGAAVGEAGDGGGGAGGGAVEGFVGAFGRGRFEDVDAGRGRGDEGAGG